MKNYTVRFYYYTDLRCSWEGMAYDDLRAYTKALDHHDLGQWCVSDGFRVEITKT